MAAMLCLATHNRKRISIVCTENLVGVGDVTESPLMSVVNSRGNRLFSPRGDPHRICFPTKSVHRAGDEVSDDG